MLRDELLRSKKDAITSCLLSRKRKLSELYFATVGLAGATGNAPVDSLYRQKEQAFLDANDISKGRYFNEATLPPLPNYAPPIPRESTEAAPQDAQPSAKPHDAAPISPPSAGDAVQPVANADQKPAAHDSMAPAPEKQEERPAPDQPALGATSDGSQGRDAPAAAAVQPAQSPVAEQKTTSKPETPLSSQDQESTETSASPRQTKQIAPSVAAPEVSSPQKKHEKRPSLALGRAAQGTDQPLSPVSSAGPYSNNTPVPVAASPDTSPAEEITESAEQVAKSPKQEESVQAPASTVPATPDEQLRLEEAQSLAASNAIGDTGGPTTNQVIQEDVKPTPGHKDSLKQEPEPLSSPVQPEPKKSDGVPPAPEEVQTPAQDQPEQMESKTDQTSATPVSKKVSPPAQPGVTPSERMTTRVSSGAIRHKSVSEILGEAPRTPTSEKGHAAESTPETPVSAARMRFKDRQTREKERSKLATVVFPKQQQQPQQDKDESLDLVRQSAGDLAKLNDEQDYLFTLFQSQAYRPPRGSHLSTLLASAHKTLSTGNHLLEYHEQMDCRTLRRIYQLQNANRWPLRQLQRSVEPPRQGTHWDVLLDHMKWMRTDFREERKWKIAAAKTCAEWCADYVNSDPHHRSLLRVNAKIPAPKPTSEKRPEDKSHTDSTMMSPPEEAGDEMPGISHPTPDLVPSMEEDSVSEGYNDEPRQDLQDTVAPAAIFSLGSDEITFSLDMTPAAQKLLEELPIYTPVHIAPDTNLPTFKESPDAVWKTEILPVSKYASGKITFPDDGPPRKRSRYDYSQYDNDAEPQMLEPPPEQTNVALFRPENKHIRDRIHPGHSFRPPTEYGMPSLGFFESRSSSQWTYAEDDELRRLVKEYTYNWSLISSCLSPSSQFTSGAERRTPWECFERWIALEGLPVDISKTPYFRAYHQRLDAAQRTVQAQQQAAQQQQQQQAQQQAAQGNSTQALPPIRRRATTPVRVDRRRSSKHLALLDAMRKLAKKRETMLQKQQHASHLASLRKANEANQPKPPISTPAEFSRMKYERELKLQERQEQYRQQMMAQQRANFAAQRAGQMPNQQSMMNAPNGRPNGMPQNSATPAVPGGTPNGMPNGVPPGVGVNQARPPMQGMPGGGPVNGPMGQNPMAMKMMQQSSMQQNNGARAGMPMQASPDNARVIREANRLQEQQRMLQSRQQQQQQQQPQPQQAQQQFHNQQQFAAQGSHSSPNLNMPNGTPNNPAMMAALQAGGGMQSPSFHHSTPQGVSTPSPRMGQPNLLSSGVVPQISNIQSQIQRNHPNLAPEQVTKLATERLHQYQQQRMSQVAINAAAGNVASVQANYNMSHDGSGGGGNFQSPPAGMNTTPSGMQVPPSQGYSPMMRVPQPAGQPNRVNVASSPAMNGAGGGGPQPSRSATPQTQRSGSAQAGPVPGSSSKSPNPPQAQTASS